jgi:hypothetical protein
LKPSHTKKRAGPLHDKEPATQRKAGVWGVEIGWGY